MNELARKHSLIPADNMGDLDGRGIVGRWFDLFGYFSLTASFPLLDGQIGLCGFFPEVGSGPGHL
jgi:hypothetical protein